MASWGQSTPAGWHRVRRLVMARDNRVCQARHPGCLDDATEVHHLGAGITAQGIGRHDDQALDPDTCVAICRPCHRIETAAQSREALRWRGRRRPRAHPADANLEPS